mmetsp:Transcript_1975/g.3078  ORF Transcript_1975/g.3078 Transcript_1975/m.3078 type:complete len:85 (+) Transcript_1975:178-432(+)
MHCTSLITIKHFVKSRVYTLNSHDIYTFIIAATKKENSFSLLLKTQQQQVKLLPTNMINKVCFSATSKLRQHSHQQSLLQVNSI